MLGSDQAAWPLDRFWSGVGTPNEGCPLFAGRKLLVADDSPYYQTVLGLTFTDEGMEVTTVGDGQGALEKLEQSTPDVILASVSMPGIGGYELCERIKQSERFGHIPVMLLAGLHEPFDQAEARRVGADDVVTKPFQSIRQLVNRVGSLLGGKAADAEDTAREYSTLGLGRPDAAAPAVPDNHLMAEPNVTVFVEAPSMIDHDSIEVAGETADRACAADVELQTADTQKLERVDDEPAIQTVEPIAYAQDDTIEMKPAIEVEEKSESPAEVGPGEQMSSQMSSIGAPDMNEKPNPQTEPLQSAAVINDALLDLGDFDSTPSVTEDLVLDLDYEEPVSSSATRVSELVSEFAAPIEAASPAEAIAAEPVDEEPPVAVAELHEWAVVAETPPEAASPVKASAEAQGSSEPGLALSPEAIDAIARRVVESLSEKVVREIAWEVVPELAELLIKKKLEEQE
jgi:CheY-like chemotaxis protein